MQIKHKYLLLLGVFSILFTSCKQDSHVLFDEYSSTNGYWSKEDIKTFVYKANDTVNPSNLFLNVRVNKDYPYSNMYVIFKIYQPDSSVMVDTLQYQMANNDGSLLGSGFSDIKENKLWLKEKYVFPSAGSYKFTLEHAVRELGEVKGIKELPGISEIGLRIETIE